MKILADFLGYYKNCQYLCRKFMNMHPGNLEKFVAKAKEIHGDKYDYSLVISNEPNSVKDKIQIICPTHGIFETTFDSHVNGKSECPKCSGVYQPNNEEFIERLKEVFKDKNYDYSQVQYVNSKTKVGIICHEKNILGKEHGIFYAYSRHLLKGHGCPNCAHRYLTTEEWIAMARKVHGDKYDYSKIEYHNDNTEKQSIICHKLDEFGDEHGEFVQALHSHLSGVGCPKCNKGVKADKNEFVCRAKAVHGEKYDYSEFVYVNARTVGTILCNIHGAFRQTPWVHLKGCGCPRCKHSRLEDRVARNLESVGLDYQMQTYIERGKQTVDFYVPEKKVYIECQGEQHYHPTSFTGHDSQEEMEKIFNERKALDEEKYDAVSSSGCTMMYYTDPSMFFDQSIDPHAGWYADKKVYTKIGEMVDELSSMETFDYEKPVQVRKRRPRGLPPVRHRWNYDTCKEEAKKYSSKHDMKLGCQPAYARAVREGWIDDFFEDKKYPDGWWDSLEHCIEASRECTNSRELVKKYGGCYNSVRKHGWTDKMEYNREKQKLDDSIDLNVDEVCKLYEEYGSIHKVGEELHTSHLLISKILREAGIKMNNIGKRRDVSDEELSSMIDDYTVNHLKMEEIAEKYSINIKRLRLLFHDNGVQVCKWDGHVKKENPARRVREPKPDVPRLTCPYCDWSTVDNGLANASYVRHLITVHDIDINEHLEAYPNDLKHLAKEKKQRETMVRCKVCGKWMNVIDIRHLATHGLNMVQYVNEYGDGQKVEIPIVGMVGSNGADDGEYIAYKDIVCKWLDDAGITYVKDDNTVIDGIVLDIFANNIAIQVNDNHLHTDACGMDKKYHLSITEKANENGIKIMQIFSDEIAERPNTVRTKIYRLFGASDGLERVYGRKCTVNEINAGIAQEFLENNHIQGFAAATVYLGAFHNGRLVGVMTFINDNDGKWNLNRFASDINMSCIGIGGKLFSYFIKHYDPIEVRSFADRRWTLSVDRNLYTNLGFELDSILPPEYRYYNPRVDKVKRFHKFGFRKEKLMKLHGFPIEMTETEMTKALGYDRIWDCGLFRYVWRKKKLD